MPFETFSTITQAVIEVDEVNRLYKMIELPNPNGRPAGAPKEETKAVDRLDKKVRTLIYTDGKLVKVEESLPIDINKYHINGFKYKYDVNQLIKKKIYIENASYIVKVIVADEVLSIGSNGNGHFDVIKDVQILLKDKKDKEAKKKAKETIKSISKDSSDYESIWDVAFGGKSRGNDSLTYVSVGSNVYTLKQKRQTR